MHEKRLCLNCNNVQPMNIHGKCPVCDSVAVVLAESIGPYDPAVVEIAELEKIFELEAK